MLFLKQIFDNRLSLSNIEKGTRVLVAVENEDIRLGLASLLTELGISPTILVDPEDVISFPWNELRCEAVITSLETGNDETRRQRIMGKLIDMVNEDTIGCEVVGGTIYICKEENMRNHSWWDTFWHTQPLSDRIFWLPENVTKANIIRRIKKLYKH